MLAEEFEAPNKWEESSVNSKDRNYLISLLNADQQLFPNRMTFCENLKHPNRILPWKRIGSLSSEAEVYQIQSPYFDVGAALKIMPILRFADEDKNQREINTAIQVSDLVKQRLSRYFPLVYGWGHCPDMILFENSQFEKKAKYHSAIVQRIQSFPGKKKLLERYEKIGVPIEDIDKQHGISELEELKIGGDFLISELAHIDLSRWASKEHSTAEWRSVLGGILLGLRDLRSLGLVHNDLHLGNILIKYVTEESQLCSLEDNSQEDNEIYDPSCLSLESKPLPLIHDFGKIESLDESNLTQDLTKIFDSLVGRPNVQLPEHYSLLLEDALVILSQIRYKSQLENLTDDLLAKL